jgi:hypothetical protein
MAIFDGRLIDPDETQLARALGKAMKSANGDNKYQTNRMTRDADFWGRFARDVLRGGPEGRRRSCKGGRDVPEVITGWWTDPAGRKHVRIVGRTRRRWTQLRRETDLRELPPWWHVYPEAVLGVRLKKEGERYLAVCRCGACGAPESLGWMGDTCGPCFDRRAEGGTVSGGFGQFTGWSPRAARFGFTASGQYLVGQNMANGFWKVRRDDGTAVTAKRKTTNTVMAVGTDAGGVTMVTQEGSVYRWAEGGNDVDIALPSRRAWARVTMTPDGHRAALISYQDAYTADLTEPRPKWARQPAPEGLYVIQYAPDGSRLLATTVTGELRAVNPATMTSEVIRTDLLDGLPVGSGGPPECVVAPDGASVLVRRESYYPRRASVRHAPLPAGKMVEMRVPTWHRATSLAYSPDGKFAVTAESEGGWVGFFEVASGKSLGFVRAVLEDVAWRSGQIEFAPDGSAVAVSYNTGHTDHGGTVAVWPWPDAMLAAAN